MDIKFYRFQHSEFNIYYWISFYDTSNDEFKMGICFRNFDIVFTHFSTVFPERIGWHNIPEDVRNSFTDFMSDPLFEIELERFKQKELG